MFFCRKQAKGGQNMSNGQENLIKIGVRIPVSTKEKLELLAENRGCTLSNILREIIDGTLEKHSTSVEYIDSEQGKEIKEFVFQIHTDIANIYKELHRLGINYNQQTKLKNIEAKYSNQQLSIPELVNEIGFVTNECDGFSKKALDEIMLKYEKVTERLEEAIMCYTRITHTKNGAAAISYCRDGHGHNGNLRRNILIGSVGMLPDELIPFEKQMQVDWALASSKNLNQVKRIVASCSKNELDPDDPESAFIMLNMAQDFIKKGYPNRKAAIFIQNDGKGHCMHAHMIISNSDSIEHKGCTDRQGHYKYVEETFDKIASEYIPLDFGKNPIRENVSPFEKHAREENQKRKDKGLEAPYFIVKDAIRDCIRLSLKSATTKESFIEELEKLGVSCRYGKTITYTLNKLPKDVIPDTQIRKFRDNKLGNEFSPENIEKQIEQNRIKLSQTELLAKKDSQNNTSQLIGIISPEKYLRHTRQPNIKETIVANRMNGAFSAISDKRTDVHLPDINACPVSPKSSTSDDNNTSSSNSTSNSGGLMKKPQSSYEKMKAMVRKADKAEKQKLLDSQLELEDLFNL